MNNNLNKFMLEYFIILILSFIALFTLSIVLSYTEKHFPKHIGNERVFVDSDGDVWF